MKLSTQLKPISYLKAHAAEIVRANRGQASHSNIPLPAASPRQTTR